MKKRFSRLCKIKNWDWKVRFTVILMCCNLYVVNRQGQHFGRDNRNGRTIQLGSSNLRHSTFVLLCWLFAYAGNGWIFGRLFRLKNSLSSGDPALVVFYYRHSLGRVIWSAWIASRSRLNGLGEAVNFSYPYIAWSQDGSPAMRRPKQSPKRRENKVSQPCFPHGDSSTVCVGRVTTQAKFHKLIRGDLNG
jgi:hypothetical protein